MMWSRSRCLTSTCIKVTDTHFTMQCVKATLLVIYQNIYYHHNKPVPGCKSLNAHYLRIMIACSLLLS